MKKTTIPFIVVCVGQACNFKCKNCGSMVPFSPKEFRHYECEEIIADIERILSCPTIGGIDLMQIQGGEPFLYKELDRLLAYVTAQPTIGKIEIATNGSLIPADTVWDWLKAENVQVRISDYSIQTDKAAALKEMCDSRGVKARYYKFTSGRSLWYYKGMHEMERDTDDEAVSQRYRSCRNRGCLHLERHRLTYCSRAANAAVIQGFEETSSDYLTVCDDASFPSDLVDYISHRHFMTACRYCYGTDESRLCTPAEQLEDH